MSIGSDSIVDNWDINMGGGEQIIMIKRAD